MAFPTYVIDYAEWYAIRKILIETKLNRLLNKTHDYFLC